MPLPGFYGLYLLKWGEKKTFLSLPSAKVEDEKKETRWKLVISALLCLVKHVNAAAR